MGNTSSSTTSALTSTNNETDIIKNSYFNLIKQTHYHFYSSLKTDNVNEYIATEKKYFNKTIPMQIEPVIPMKSNLNWKYDIINYFYKHINNNNIRWYRDIVDEIMHEPFLSENKYLSYMFYSDYGYRSIPSILKSQTERTHKLSQHELLEKKILNMSAIANNTANSSNRQSNLVHSKIVLNVTDIYGGSMGSYQEDNTFNEYNKDSVLRRNRIKDLTKIFKSHINNNDHPIRIIINIFEKKISYIIQNKKEEFKSLKRINEDEYYEQLKQLSDSSIYHIQKFIIKAQRCLKLFYSNVCDLSCFFEEKDEILNCITTVLFESGTLYKEIYDLFTLQLERDVNKFRLKLAGLQDITTQELGIKPKFALDNRTKELQCKLKEKQTTFNNVVDNIISNNNEHERGNLNVNMIISQSEEKQINMSEQFRKRNALKGFDTLKTVLTSVVKVKTPFEKMVLIASLSTEITECVNEFWKGYENYISNSYLLIAADDLMPLYIYAIIQANFPEILIHNKIINGFTSKTTKSTMVGYYFSTIEGATEYLLNTDERSIRGDDQQQQQQGLQDESDNNCIKEEEEEHGMSANNKGDLLKEQQ